MSREPFIPRILIVDDLFGRILPDRRNEERASLCSQLLLRDVTGDELDKESGPQVKRPIAEVVFCRGQQPKSARVGDTIENDLPGTLQMIREGWLEWRPDRPRWAMVLLDLCFYTGRVTDASNSSTTGTPEGRPGDDNSACYFGIELLKSIHLDFPELPVVILSSKPREAVSREFSQYGALAFLPRAAADAPEKLRTYINDYGLIPDDANEIIGHSKPLLLALREARRAADLRNVLIRGPRGTGKELLARYINRHSGGGKARKLVVVDSGSLSPHLYASELFGHKKGAFTGAAADRVGRTVEASGGDLFLDEIGNLPPDVQVGLLRVLEDKLVTPVGGDPQPVDARFVSATNEDIEGKAATGGFRQDLLDRLREGGTVFLRPLSERIEDIDDLVEQFVRRAEQNTPGAMYRRTEPEALVRLREHSWPGNIRELRSCIFNAVRDYPHVEHLVPVQLRFDEEHASTHGERTKPTAVASAATFRESDIASAPGQLITVDELIALIERCDFGDAAAPEIAGRLPALQAACKHVLAQLLRAGLVATKKVTPAKPSGEILIHPAIKLLVGDDSVTAVWAKDEIKRILGASPTTERLLESDPILLEALTRSKRGR